MKVDEKYFAKSSMEYNAIDDILHDDEAVLWRDKPDRRSYIAAAFIKMLPIAILWLVVDSGFIIGISIGMSRGSIPLALLGFIIPFFLLHLAPVWVWISNILKAKLELKNIEYALTDKRIIARSGVVGVDFKYIHYSEVQSVNVKVGLIDKIFKVGDIYITAQHSSVVLYDIHDPYRISTRIQKVALDIQSDINYPNALRPDSNPGYNTRYDNNPFLK